MGVEAEKATVFSPVTLEFRSFGISESPILQTVVVCEVLGNQGSREHWPGLPSQHAGVFALQQKQVQEKAELPSEEKRKEQPALPDPKLRPLSPEMPGSWGGALASMGVIGVDRSVWGEGEGERGQAGLPANHDSITSIALPVPFVSIVPLLSCLTILLVFSHLYLVNPFSTCSACSDAVLSTHEHSG